MVENSELGGGFTTQSATLLNSDIKTKRNVLGMGMCFIHEKYAAAQIKNDKAGQGVRDRMRCFKLENDFDFKNYTVDNKHQAADCEIDRHYFGRFDVPSFPQELMRTLPIEGEIYLVLFDLYFVLDGEWIKESWKVPLFTEVIPGIF